MVLFDFVIYRLNQGLQWIVGFTFCKTGKPTIHLDLNNLVYLRLGWTLRLYIRIVDGVWSNVPGSSSGCLSTRWIEATTVQFYFFDAFFVVVAAKKKKTLAGLEPAILWLKATRPNQLSYRINTMIESLYCSSTFVRFKYRKGWRGGVIVGFSLWKNTYRRETLRSI